MNTDHSFASLSDFEGARPAPESTIFVNRNLRMDNIKIIGFDMDYTLARYHKRAIEELDPKNGMKEHPGGFLLRRDEKMVVIAGDGRLLYESGDDLWARYMAGESVGDLAQDVESRLLGSEDTDD